MIQIHPEVLNLEAYSEDNTLKKVAEAERLYMEIDWLDFDTIENDVVRSSILIGKEEWIRLCYNVGA
jgi:hypothetical protein